jgi:drug/metabolite transporter (DMT)-like permease
LSWTLDATSFTGMSERLGVAAAILSSTFGGMAAATTRFVVADLDAVTIGALRYGGGCLVLLPLALARVERWPRGRDWLGVAGLGLLFFGLFPVVYNLALAATTAARGALALSTLPLLTMLAAAVLGIEKLTLRKSVGVVLAVLGVAAALAAGLDEAPPGAWRGDLLMVLGAFCMALYNIWSRPFVRRSGILAFTTAGMGIGSSVLVAIAAAEGSFGSLATSSPGQLVAVLYLAMFGGAVAFLLWVFALERASPTRVATTMTVNPVAASLLASVIVAEPIGLELVIGIAAVLAGIWIASTPDR